MKRNFKFYLAFYLAKITYHAMRLLGKQATTIPGLLAFNICPDFLGRIRRPEKVIGITGTNGKTTVSNMVEDVLDDCGYVYTCNREGSNVKTGLISALVGNADLLGRPKRSLAVFEIDERSAPIIFPYLKPDILLCTNLFRDSFKRNAHTEFIFSLINQSITDNTLLILNGDDLISCGLKESNQRLFFGIPQQEGETAAMKNIVCDIRSCPKCGETLTWDFIRYHHIGQAHCPACGYANPALDFVLTDIDKQNHRLTITYQNEVMDFPIINDTFINLYNSLSAISLLLTMGVPAAKIAAAMAKMKISKSRYDEKVVGGKNIIMHLAKGQNPIACSRAFENAKDFPGKKTVFLYLDDLHDAMNSVENIAWYYDTDFEFLKDDSIGQIIISGVRHHDVYVRLLIAGVPKEKMTHYEVPETAINDYRPDESETLFVIYDLFNLEIIDRVEKRAEEIILQAQKEEQA